MCGISGIFHPNAITQIDKNQVATMLSIIRHRGPDSCDIYQSSPHICFGSVRLAMTDSKTKINWLSNENSSILLVFNGEIYNHKELRFILEKLGHEFKTGSDGEVILHLYEEKGLDFLNELDGMFAFALWDSNQELFLLARDPLGIKPLYYQIDQNKLLFASELKALTSIASFKPDIDLVSLSSYIHYRFVAPPRTIFQNFYKLAPGTVLVAQKGTINIKTYWKISFGTEKVFSFSSFIDIWKEALQTTTISDQKIGIFLSGGLDSSGILATLSDLQYNIPTFTIGYENNTENDEGQFAATLSQILKSPHEYQQIKNDEISSDLSKVIWHLDEPLYSTVNLSTYRLSKMASQKVKGVLTGDGSDELLLGYSYLLKAMDAFNKVNNWKETYLYQIGWMTGNWAKQLCENEIINNKEDLLLGYSDINPADAMRYFEIKYRLPEYHLTRMDRLSMAHGLEARLPLLRKKLVKLLLSYSSERLLIPGKQKEILKQAFSKLLPQNFIERKKQSFTSPYIQWLKGPLKEEVYDLILNSNDNHFLFLKKKGLQDVLKNCYQGDGSAFSVLWGIFILYKWYGCFSKELSV